MGKFLQSLNSRITDNQIRAFVMAILILGGTLSLFVLMAYILLIGNLITLFN
jgi:hypothetical protein